MSALISWVLAAALYLYVNYVAKPTVNWGSAGRLLRYLNAVKNLHELTVVSDHVKAFRYVCVPFD